MKIIKNFFTSIKYNILALFFFILIWFILSLFFEDYLIPSPLLIFKNLKSHINSTFIQNLRITFSRLILGFFSSYLLGTAVGILTYKLKIKTTFNTFLILLEVIPGVILGVIFLLLFGIGNLVPFFMVFFLTLPLIAINTSNSLYKTNKLMEEVVVSFNGNSVDILNYIYLPGLIPTLISNLTLGFSLALKVVILGEFIGSQEGIGYLLNVSRIYFNMNEIFFYLTIMIIIMLGFQILIDFFKDLLLKKFFYKE
ncbi:MAG: ABC transporter permease subunit [Spirochaetes bacterium]|nr:ABC transporter permease subunit [Spirochaetota bacterium]